MERLYKYIPLVIIFTILPGCKGNGSTAPTPNNVAVVAGDTSATVTWDMLAGVDYWIFKAAASEITPTSCIGMPQCQIFTRAISPTVISGLTNSTTYSFTVNGRIDGGKGGSGSTSIQALPRLAGATWNGGTSPGADDLRAVTYGTKFVAVGSNGKLFSSTNGLSWASLTNPLPTVNLNGITYSNGKYIAVGAGGVILSSTDAITWMQKTSGATEDLFAVSSNGLGGYAATGANGTIIFSSNGETWSPSTFSNTNALYAITYGNGKYVAVGAAGILITSIDGGSNWTFPNASLSTTLSAINLKTVSFGDVKDSVTGKLTGTFVVLGDSGTLVTNIDNSNWVMQAYTVSTSRINASTFGRQFVAVDNIGGIYYSLNGLDWSAATSTPTSTTALYAVTHGPYDYTTVGAGGVNLHSK